VIARKTVAVTVANPTLATWLNRPLRDALPWPLHQRGVYSLAMLLHSKRWMRKVDRAVWYTWAILGVVGAIALGFGLTLK
jgi:hypothetical protein